MKERKKLSREEKRKLWDIELPDWTDEELLQSLRESYEPTVVPPCHICGRELSIQAIGGGKPTVWACSGRDDNDSYLPGRGFIDEHYSNSRYEDRRQGGDERVMELVARFNARARKDDGVCDVNMGNFICGNPMPCAAHSTGR